MPGFQILDLLKSDAECRDIPVIINTSRALDGEERRSLDGRVAAILDKCIGSQEEAASGLLRPGKARSRAERTAREES